MANDLKTSQTPIISKLTLILAALMAGCATQTICVPIDLPNRPTLIPTPEHVWELVPLEGQDIWANNDLSLKAYIKQIEGRIKLHNEVCGK
jgi:hypothetical protein